MTGKRGAKVTTLMLVKYSQNVACWVVYGHLCCCQINTRLPKNQLGPVSRTWISELARYVELKVWLCCVTKDDLFYHHGDLCLQPNLVWTRLSAQSSSSLSGQICVRSFLTPLLTMLSSFVGVPVDLRARTVQGLSDRGSQEQIPQHYQIILCMRDTGSYQRVFIF